MLNNGLIMIHLDYNNSQVAKNIAFLIRILILQKKIKINKIKNFIIGQFLIKLYLLNLGLLNEILFKLHRKVL